MAYALCRLGSIRSAVREAHPVIAVEPQFAPTNGDVPFGWTLKFTVPGPWLRKKAGDGLPDGCCTVTLLVYSWKFCARVGRKRSIVVMPNPPRSTMLSLSR